jgi:hypothetical protein
MGGDLAARRILVVEEGLGPFALNGRIEAFEVADAALARDVLLVLATGYDTGTIPERYRSSAVIQKPCDSDAIGRKLTPIRYTRTGAAAAC